MASTLVEIVRTLNGGDNPTTYQVRNSLTAGLEENIDHGLDGGPLPFSVRSETVIEPTDGSPISFTWVEGDGSLTGETVRCRWDTTPGGSLTGAQVKLICTFAGVKRAGNAIVG